MIPKPKPASLVLCALAAVLLALTPGCGGLARHTPATHFGKAHLQANFERDDLEVIGPVTGKSTTKMIAGGLVQIIDGDKWQVLGIRFFQDQCAFDEDMPYPFLFSATARRAYYRALESTPDADAVFSKSFTRSCRGFGPIYAIEEYSFQGKAIRIKTDK